MTHRLPAPQVSCAPDGNRGKKWGNGAVMTRFGYFLASEEHRPQELIRQAEMAEQAGFEALSISDHFHPWLDEQGESSFVWSTIGALSQATSLPITTAV